MGNSPGESKAKKAWPGPALAAPGEAEKSVGIGWGVRKWGDGGKNWREG